MGSKEPLNIKYKSQINKIGYSLILARKAVEEENRKLQLSSKQLLRLVLFGCLCVELQQSRNTDNLLDFEEGKTFATLSGYISSQTDNNWIQKYLNLSDFRMSLIKYDIAYKHLKGNLSNSQFGNLLPYALELLDYSENDIESSSTDKRNGIVTRKKKKNGIYYTPTDVASYMVETCVRKLLNEHTSIMDCRFMDFSCGSGIFLLQIIEYISIREKNINFKDYISYINSSLFAMDISEHAVDCSRYTILAYSIRKFQNQNLCVEQLLHVLEQNIISTDATKLTNYYNNHPDYPQRFDCIIGNPPYVGITKNSETWTQSTSSSNLFIPFVTNLIDYSSPNSVCALVLPLSFSYNNQPSFKHMRKIIEKDNAEWFIEHYDRSPDSLFGDDVKSRSCIVFRSHETTDHRIYVTGLLRWTSNNRHRMLSSPKDMTDITELQIQNYIPKLGSSIEKKAFSTIITCNSPLLNQLNVNSPEYIFKIVVKGTAYNWICAYDHIPPSQDKNGNKYVSKDLKIYAVQTEDDAYFILAVLNSTISFWLWTVIGDGFHVTSRLLSSICISKELFNKQQYFELVLLGKEFSDKIKQYPSKSVNSGKTITNYDHQPLQTIISKIDSLISEVVGLPMGFPEYLHEWYINIVSCGRSSKKRDNMNPIGGNNNA